MPETGQRVRLRAVPDWVSALPEESRRVFRYCVGRVFPVAEVDQNGLLVLDVSEVVDRRFGGFMNDIRVEPIWVEPVI